MSHDFYTWSFSVYAEYPLICFNLVLFCRLTILYLLSFKVLAIQPDLVARDIALRFNIFVICLLLKLLGVINILLIYGYQILELRKKFFYSSQFWIEIEIFFVGNTKIISAIEFEKYIADISIFDIIVYKLRHKKNLCPIILFKINKDLKIGFYYTILFFSLAVSLWVEDGIKSPLDAKKIV